VSEASAGEGSGVRWIVAASAGEGSGVRWIVAASAGEGPGVRWIGVGIFALDGKLTQRPYYNL
jgi:hypothetical protein